MDNVMRVVLAWPPRELHPNARPDRWTLARKKRAYRTECRWEAQAAGVSRAHGARGLRVSIVFHPPDHRRRDLDGMLSAVKSGLDGLCDMIGIDDSTWELRIARGEKAKNGRVVVTMEAL